MIYDLIGEIYTPVVLDSEGTILSGGEVVADVSGSPYYHVNTLPPLAESLEQYVVTPETQVRVFAGRDDTICLKFSSRDEWLSKGFENVEEA